MLRLKRDVASLMKKGILEMVLAARVHQFKNQIERKISYSFLDRHTKNHKINLYKLKAIIYLLHHSKLSKSIQEKYVISTILVEIALDTHEQVKENAEIQDHYDKNLTKQLSVLGGDYYSSLYYVLLSEIEDYSFIHYLATSIKEVNELKMDFHFQESTNLDDYLKLRKRIESYIINSVANYVNVNDPNLLQALELIFIIDVLVREKDHYKNENSFKYFKQEQIQNELYQRLNIIINQLKADLKNLFQETENYHLLQLKTLYKDLVFEDRLVYMEEG